jgi:hypothetical protein
MDLIKLDILDYNFIHPSFYLLFYERMRKVLLVG